MKLSDCHYKPIDEETGTCSYCGKECRVLCPTCEGAGDVMGRVHSQTITPPYITCPTCRGAKTFEIDEEIPNDY